MPNVTVCCTRHDPTDWDPIGVAAGGGIHPKAGRSQRMSRTSTCGMDPCTRNIRAQARGGRHQYFPKSLKSLEVCVDGRFYPQDSILFFSLSLLVPATSKPCVRLCNVCMTTYLLSNKTCQL